MPRKSADAAPEDSPTAAGEAEPIPAAEGIAPLTAQELGTVAARLSTAAVRLPASRRTDASAALPQAALAADGSNPLAEPVPMLDLVSRLVLATQVAPVRAPGQAAAAQPGAGVDTATGAGTPPALGDSAVPALAGAASSTPVAVTADASTNAGAVAATILLPMVPSVAAPASVGRQPAGVAADMASAPGVARRVTPSLTAADVDTVVPAGDAASTPGATGDRVLSWTASSLVAGAADAGGSEGPSTPTVLAPLALPTQTSDAPAAWQQPLLQALGERLNTQWLSRGEQAVLHLSPPQLGRIDIAIRQQGGVLEVQMSATHEEVVTQLRQISEPLRHELVQRHAGEVSVQVAGGGLSGSEPGGREASRQGGQGQDPAAGQQQRSRDDRSPARARDEAEAAAAEPDFPAGFAERMSRTANATIG